MGGQTQVRVANGNRRICVKMVHRVEGGGGGEDGIRSFLIEVRGSGWVGDSDINEIASHSGVFSTNGGVATGIGHVYRK